MKEMWLCTKMCCVVFLCFPPYGSVDLWLMEIILQLTVVYCQQLKVVILRKVFLWFLVQAKKNTRMRVVGAYSLALNKCYGQ